tara:strand:- start:865 stop:1479 length:615 start_codon:yes stop_codon:yes gene_type:complete
MSKIIEKYIIEVIKDKNNILSEGLRFHINENIPISTNIYRRGSEKYFDLLNETRSLYNEGLIELNHDIDKMYISELEVGVFDMYEGNLVPIDYPMYEDEELFLEAKYKGKKVKIGKAGAKKIGNGKACVYVYTGKKNKDGTRKVKKVTFGSEMPTAMGDSEEHRKRRKSFGDRHQCSKKKDKTKPGYWSCRLTKLFGRNIPGWW